MKMRTPLALLLGGLLSASGIGCSAMSALSGNAGSKAAGGRPPADRLAAIGRVFENQGHYDQAEVMYRRALKQSPNDSVIEDQLASLTERRKSREFGADKTRQAIAQADNVSTGRAVAGRMDSTRPANESKSIPATAPSLAAAARVSVLPTQEPAAEVTVARKTASETPATSVAATATPAVPQPESQQSAEVLPFLPDIVERKPQIQPATMIDLDADTTGRVRTISLAGPTDSPEPLEDALPPAPQSQAALPTVDEFAWDAVTTESAAGQITTEQLLAAVNDPGSMSSQLLLALDQGDSIETKTLAAALLGECEPSDTLIRDTLASHLTTATDHGFVLAIADSQIQRGEANSMTAECMTAIAGCPTSQHQVQAVTGLRHFAGTPSQSICVQTLRDLLISESQDIRASAAVTLGDFASGDDITLAALTELAAEDNESSVRAAARAAISRRTSANNETAEAIQIQPAK